MWLSSLRRLKSHLRQVLWSPTYPVVHTWLLDPPPLFLPFQPQSTENKKEEVGDTHVCLDIWKIIFNIYF